jgi:hypothetical protein
MFIIAAIFLEGGVIRPMTILSILEETMKETLKGIGVVILAMMIILVAFILFMIMFGIGPW